MPVLSSARSGSVAALVAALAAGGHGGGRLGEDDALLSLTSIHFPCS